mmetsp:Transcript_7966/g.9757  ORF Transcript_7966/g.9757 Transcript_7966/m.9757 type:complete len:100 (+) Transcript_7966:2-301(+)
MIRYEDLLFHPKKVVRRICHCAGGEAIDTFVYLANNAKDDPNDPNNETSAHYGSSDLVGAIMRYANERLRGEGFTKNDLKYAKNELNKNLMKTFNYKLL